MMGGALAYLAGRAGEAIPGSGQYRKIVFPNLSQVFVARRVLRKRTSEDIEMQIVPKSMLPAICVAFTCQLMAQTDSRLAEIAARQEEKSANVRQDEPNKVERGMLWFREEDPFRKFSTGIGGFR